MSNSVAVVVGIIIGFCAKPIELLWLHIFKNVGSIVKFLGKLFFILMRYACPLFVMIATYFLHPFDKEFVLYFSGSFCVLVLNMGLEVANWNRKAQEKRDKALIKIFEEATDKLNKPTPDAENPGKKDH